MFVFFFLFLVGVDMPGILLKLASAFMVREGTARWFYTASAARGSGPGSSHRQPEHAQFIPALLQDVLQTYTTLIGRICPTAAAIDGQGQTNSH